MPAMHNRMQANGMIGKLTGFAGGARVIGVALAASVEAFPVDSARNGTRNEGEIKLCEG